MCNTHFGCKEFYKTVKPFISDKGNGCHGSNIILREGDAILTDSAHEADIFNTYYASIAEYESESDSIDNLAFSELIEKHYTHESIDLIRSKISFTCAFIFNFTSPEIFAKYIDKLQSNKAVGYDGLKASFIKKISVPQLCNSLCELFNIRIKAPSFLSGMKLAEIRPIFKRGATFVKKIIDPLISWLSYLSCSRISYLIR